MKKGDYYLRLSIFILLIAMVGLTGLMVVQDIHNAKQQPQIEQLKIDISDLKSRLDLTEKRLDVVRKATVTAYSPEVRQTDIDPTNTAFMTVPKPGTVAVSWDLLRSGWTPGRKVWVENVGVLVINDLMNRRWENRLDVFFHEREQALAFGKRELKVVLIFE